MTKKKILLWQWGRRGGGPRYMLELARALKDEGQFDIHLSISKQSEFFAECAGLNLPTLAVDTYSSLPGALIASIRLPFLRRKFWRYVQDNDIDLVVGAMSHLWNVPMLAGRKNKTPYLMVLHDALPHPGDDVPLRHWLLAREIGHAGGVVTLTQHVQGILCNAYHYPKNRSWVVPHGVFAYAKPAGHMKSAGPVQLLFFGRILPYKGLDMLLEAYGMLRAEGLALELTICGSGDMRPYEAKLAMLGGVHIDNRWIGEADMGAIFQRADISVSPYREASQSGVIAVAYAAGVPVVVTPIGGLVEQVKHEVTGLICDKATPASIADALRRMISDPELRARCATGALREASETLSWPAIARQFTGAMQHMLEQR